MGVNKTWLKSKCFTESSLLIIGTDRDRKTGGMRATLARAEARGWWMQVQLSLACLQKRGRSWGIGLRLRSEAPNPEAKAERCSMVEARARCPRLSFGRREDPPARDGEDRRVNAST
jgi:hypothetical protein